jgi:hypothetical protein
VQEVYLVTVFAFDMMMESEDGNVFVSYYFMRFFLHWTMYIMLSLRRASYAVMCLVSMERLYAIVVSLKTFSDGSFI